MLEILRNQVDFLRKKYPIEYLGIFGSYSRGTPTFSSDVDILVEFSKPIDIFTFIELNQLLEEELGLKVDLVTKAALKPQLAPEILREVVYV